MPRFPWQLELALHHRSLWLYESKVLCLVTLIRDILKGGAHVNHLPHSRGKETDKTGLLRFLQSLSFMVVNAQRGPVIYTSLRDAWGHQSYLWGWKDCSLSWQLKGVNTCRPRLGLYLKKIAKKKEKEKKSAFGCPLLLWQRRHVEWKSQVAGFLWEPDFQLLRCREEGEGAGV